MYRVIFDNLITDDLHISSINQFFQLFLLVGGLYRSGAMLGKGLDM